MSRLLFSSCVRGGFHIFGSFHSAVAPPSYPHLLPLLLRLSAGTPLSPLIGQRRIWWWLRRIKILWIEWHAVYHVSLSHLAKNPEKPEEQQEQQQWLQKGNVTWLTSSTHTHGGTLFWASLRLEIKVSWIRHSGANNVIFVYI